MCMQRSEQIVSTTASLAILLPGRSPLGARGFWDRRRVSDQLFPDLWPDPPAFLYRLSIDIFLPCLQVALERTPFVPCNSPCHFCSGSPLYKEPAGDDVPRHAPGHSTCHPGVCATDVFSALVCAKGNGTAPDTYHRSNHCRINRYDVNNVWEFRFITHLNKSIEGAGSNRRYRTNDILNSRGFDI